MADRISEQHRSWNMAQIKSRNTSPELAVRKVLYSMCFRYRLHSASVPGKPDIILKKYRSVIFVHGCFWHRHPGCKLAYTPKSRIEFWNKKFESNVRRDERIKDQLSELNWRRLVIWECQTKDRETIKKMLREFLGGYGNNESPGAE